MGREPSGEAPRYELVASEYAQEATRRFILEGGIIPICNPHQRKAVQRAIDSVTARDGWDDERRERLGVVLSEMVEARELTAETRFQGDRLKSANSSARSHGHGTGRGPSGRIVR